MKTQRSRFKIPDDYQKDTHLTNWLRKNMMPELEACFIRDKCHRGTLNKLGTSLHSSEIICGFKNNTVVRLNTSESMFMEKL